jgi:hypothetical protein
MREAIPGVANADHDLVDTRLDRFRDVDIEVTNGCFSKPHNCPLT